MKQPTMEEPTSPKLPRVAITYCTQCRWMLRAAYVSLDFLQYRPDACERCSVKNATPGLIACLLPTWDVANAFL
jgi:predicted Rdx family selenoprotein